MALGIMMQRASLSSATMRRYLSTSTPEQKTLVIPIELISDTLWPNGYIGKKQLHRAMRHMSDRPPSQQQQQQAQHKLAFTILRVPFFLEPDYPEDRVSVGTNRERLLQKWGGPAGWEAQKLRHDLKGRGRAAGIPHFNLDRLTGNTMASHRLIQHVGKLYGWAVSETLYDRLNVYYFVDGHSLNDKPRLAKVAAEVLENVSQPLQPSPTTPILSEEDILTFLNGTEGRKEIKEALQMLQSLNIHSIPQFIVEGTTVVGGAADWTTFVKIFEDIERRGSVRNEGRTIFGGILGVPEMMNTTLETGSA